MSPNWCWWRKQCKEDMVEFKYPRRLSPGDEVVCETLSIGPISNKTRITFHWGDQYVQVLGANMVAPNVFEFPATEKKITWYLKYCVSQNAKQSSKCLYLTIDKIKTNKSVIWLARLLAALLFILPLLLYIDRASGINIVAQTARAEFSLGQYSLTLPISLCIFVALWTTKITELINRLASVKEVVDVAYEGKGVSSKYIEIVMRPTTDDYHRNNRSYIDLDMSPWESIWRSQK